MHQWQFFDEGRTNLETLFIIPKHKSYKTNVKMIKLLLTNVYSPRGKHPSKI